MVKVAKNNESPEGKREAKRANTLTLLRIHPHLTTVSFSGLATPPSKVLLPPRK